MNYDTELLAKDIHFCHKKKAPERGAFQLPFKDFFKIIFVGVLYEFAGCLIIIL